MKIKGKFRVPTFQQICDAHARITPHIHQTPVVTSSLLNQWLGSRIMFKAECMQKTGAFKIRGALNMVSSLAESDALPRKLIANSSGNHAQAVACVADMFDIDAEIYSSKTISAVKAAATRSYGAELKLFDLRVDADRAVAEAAENNDVVWVPPYNHPDIIAGQGTLALDALTQVGDVDAIFAPCGGGGLLSGTLISTRDVCPQAKVIGAEPLAANDAAESRRQGRIVPLPGPASTLADGAATPSVGEHTFGYIQQLDDLVEVNETRIAYWTQWLQHLLKLHVEPTSAMVMEAVINYLKSSPKNQTLLVLISGGNIDQRNMLRIWEQDHLSDVPSSTMSI